MNQLHRAIVLVLLLLVFAAAASADNQQPPVEGKPTEPNARQTVQAFLNAALAGQVKQARMLTVRGQVPEKQLTEFRDMIKGGKMRVATVYAAEKGRQPRAFAITEPVQITKPNPDGRDKGPLTFKLDKVNNKWLVRDIDFDADDRAKEKLAEFRKRYPDAKEVLEKKR